MLKNIILCHHERYDGRGYPYRLRGRSVPLEARIVKVADVLESLLSARPYKEEWKPRLVKHYFACLSGTEFDPDIVAALVRNFDKFVGVYCECTTREFSESLKVV
nr:HD domain-containing phosphohydrolase [Vibrio crassostreae]